MERVNAHLPEIALDYDELFREMRMRELRAPVALSASYLSGMGWR
jgi:hypothetical protein